MRARRLSPLPPWLSRAITLPILLAMGSLFFLTPVEIDCNVANLVVAACQKGNAAVVQAVMCRPCRSCRGGWGHRAGGLGFRLRAGA